MAGNLALSRRLEQPRPWRQSAAMNDRTDFRIGVDLGGSKTEILAIGQDGAEIGRSRMATPAGYEASLTGIAGMVRALEHRLGGRGSVGIGIPGVISPATGLVKNANTIALNGHPFDRDIAARLGRKVRVENDANCFALSEAADGAGAGHAVVFGVILGTGCGCGIVAGGNVLRGRHHIAGEWGHTPLPWPTEDETPGPLCWCGKHNCLETWVSGPGLARDCDGPDARDATGIAARAEAGDIGARAALARHAERLARGLAVIIDIIDPDVIVLGGGLSNMVHLYGELPLLMRPHVFSDFVHTPVLQARHGDSSGVRGAAWLWPVPAG
jgi:fructokinase